MVSELDLKAMIVKRQGNLMVNLIESLLYVALCGELFFFFLSSSGD
jgi:hypothetical protein